MPGRKTTAKKEEKAAPTQDLFDLLGQTRDRIEGELLTGEHPDLILAGLTNVSRAIQQVQDQVQTLAQLERP